LADWMPILYFSSLWIMFCSLGSILLLVLLLSGCPGPAGVAAGSRRPNVLLLLTDDWLRALLFDVSVLFNFVLIDSKYFYKIRRYSVMFWFMYTMGKDQPRTTSVPIILNFIISSWWGQSKSCSLFWDI
jgi:hypothetical protein